MRRRALLAASQMTGGGQPDTPSKDEWDYYTVIPEEDCEVQITPFAGTDDFFVFEMEYECFPFSYRINGGNWIDVSLGTTANIIQTISVKANDKIQVKCYGVNFNPFAYSSDTYFIKIEPLCKFKVGGTPMSLLYGDDFKENNIALGNRLDILLFNSNVTEILNPDTFLPYTELEIGCYYYLFSNCTELTNAPVLPAKVLTEDCYCGMFYNCAKINHIKMLATDISAEYCLHNWVVGVSSTGTFVKHPEATWDVRGVNGVPEGWTIKFDGEEESVGSIYACTLHLESFNGAVSITTSSPNYEDYLKAYEAVISFGSTVNGDINDNNIPDELDIRVDGQRITAFYVDGSDIYISQESVDGSFWFGNMTKKSLYITKSL